MPPTTEQFSSYQVMFDHFNRELFGGQLPHVILNFSRDLKRAVGYYAVNRWESEAKKVDEITLNPDHLKRGPQATAATLVHEMVHLWQQSCGKPSAVGRFGPFTMKKCRPSFGFYKTKYHIYFF